MLWVTPFSFFEAFSARFDRECNRTLTAHPFVCA
jgi:hypothetical protein